MKKPTARSKKATASSAWLTVRNSGDCCEMTIDGPIGKSWYDPTGIASKEFCEALDAVPEGMDILLKIHSEGGSVGDALTMHNALDARGGVTCKITGYCLSSATIVALGCDRVISPSAAIWMIHEPWSMTTGDQDDMLRAAEMLDKHGDTIAQIYSDATGKDVDEMRAAMKAETWFTGDEAVDFGLADDEAEADDADELMENLKRQPVLNLGGLHNVPDFVLNMFRAEPGSQKTKAQSAGPSVKARTISATNGGKAGNAASNPQPTQSQPVVIKDMETIPIPVAAANPPAQNIDALAQAVERERKARISAEVTRRAENKITNDRLAWWVDQAMANEEQTYAQLDALPVARPGGKPIGTAPAGDEPRDTVYEVVNADKMSARVMARPGKRLGFMNEIHDLKSPHARLARLKQDWTGKMNYAIEADAKACGGNLNALPVNANSITSTLITDFLVDVAITQLQNRWSALEAFTRDFSTDRYKPLATGEIKLVTAGATTLAASKTSYITNFESGDSTTTAISVPMYHLAQPFHVAQDELMAGLRLENLTSINLAVLADTIINRSMLPLASSTYTAGTYWASKGTFGWTNEMPDLRGYLKKSPLKNVVLDAPYFSRLINQPGFFQKPDFTDGPVSSCLRGFGWDVIAENTNWTGAPWSVAGVALNPQAICAVAGLPMTPPSIPGATLQETVITIPGPDISIAQYVWFSLASRTLWTSYDVVFGAAAGDTTAAALLFNGIGPRS